MSDLPNTIIVWLVEDNEVYRLGVSSAIESADGMRCAEAYLTLFNQLAEAKNPPAPDYGLSAREKQILEQMAQGLVNKEIAAVLDISPHSRQSPAQYLSKAACEHQYRRSGEGDP